MRIATPWIYSPRFDLVAIIGPPLLATAVVWALGRQLVQIDTMPTWMWVVLVLGIDVAHVYSSLFRTYFDREEFQRRRTLYILTPLGAWGIGAGLYAGLGPTFFWSCVAYFAIYHFVRQQYGFLMLYRRGEAREGWAYRVDQAAIYLATVYPLVYWHTFPRDFQWFSDFDVIRIPSVWPELLFRGLYIATLAAFFAKEAWTWRQSGTFNLGKVALFTVTAAAWGTGIILFNGDLTFSIINIVSHGIPYMALVWIYQVRKRAKPEAQSNRYLQWFRWQYLPFAFGFLLLLAFIEEGLWDRFVWREQVSLFGPSTGSLAPLVLVFVVPLLTMPQVTHYFLDAFIWRVNKGGGREVRAVIGS